MPEITFSLGEEIALRATAAISTVEGIIGTILVAAFVIVVGFFMFKKAKSAINKA